MSGPEVTFRDFAAAIMSGNHQAASGVLETLLALDPAAAGAATVHFDAHMKSGGQEFMMKAMALRTAVASAGEDEGPMRELLAACFGLGGEALERAAGALRARHG